MLLGLPAHSGSHSDVQKVEAEDDSFVCVGLGEAVPFYAKIKSSVKQFCFPFSLPPHCLSQWAQY